MEEIKTDSQEVAKEILNQLGGNKFIVMTGAKNLLADSKSLTFKIMRNSKKITHLRIELNCLDTYDITFYNIPRDKTINQYKVCGIYADQLQGVFTSNTGLDTHL